MAVGVDHDLSPREDLSKYAEAAVEAGKLRRRRLDQIRRMQSAHMKQSEMRSASDKNLKMRDASRLAGDHSTQ